ncbi:GNAT family N-acetyltransferase [Longimicrobium sp.]|jgi:GNAT superfamily N-acetyltransferase|uniref:GNAT family N-acetyltransferase n=1 Tax=Longimicrobium sp. TaxID=2029185 RepID=UPI002F927C35
MKTEEPTVEEFGPDDPRIAAFHAVRDDVAYPTPDEPVPVGMRCLVAFRGGAPVARLSYGTGQDVGEVPGPCALIGHYERTDRSAGVWLLDEAVIRVCVGHQFHALGPINGSTWGRYRLALPPRTEDEGDAEPPFLSEPWNPPDYPADFEEAGFRVVATYESAIVEDLAAADPRRDELAERVRARGATIRALDLDRFDDELRAIFELSRTAFAENLFYSPIEFDEFRARYLPLRPLLDPEMVRLAEDADGRLLGFVFAFPDVLSAEPGGRPTRVVLKTLASAPEARGLGLGTFLTDEVRRVAHEKGYRSVIHALMQADNESVRISRHSARVFRRYALYELVD